MTPQHIAALKTEIELPAYNGQTPQQIAEALNSEAETYFIEPDTPDITNFLFNSGLYAKLLAVYRDHPLLQIRVAAEAAIDLAQSQIPTINLMNPNTQQTLGVLVSGNVWTQNEANSLMDFAKHSRSRAQQLLGDETAPLTALDIQRVLNQENIEQLQSQMETVSSVCGAILSQLQSTKHLLDAGAAPTVLTAEQIVQLFSDELTTSFGI